MLAPKSAHTERECFLFSCCFPPSPSHETLRAFFFLRSPITDSLPSYSNLLKKKENVRVCVGAEIDEVNRTEHQTTKDEIERVPYGVSDTDSVSGLNEQRRVL